MYLVSVQILGPVKYYCCNCKLKTFKDCFHKLPRSKQQHKLVHIRVKILHEISGDSKVRKMMIVVHTQAHGMGQEMTGIRRRFDSQKDPLCRPCLTYIDIKHGCKVTYICGHLKFPILQGTFFLFLQLPIQKSYFYSPLKWLKLSFFYVYTFFCQYLILHLFSVNLFLTSLNYFINS